MKRCEGCGKELVVSAQGSWECISEGCPNAAEALRLRPRRGRLLALPKIFSGIALVNLIRGEVGRFEVGSRVILGIALEDVSSGRRGHFSLWEESEDNS